MVLVLVDCAGGFQSAQAEDRKPPVEAVLTHMAWGSPLRQTDIHTLETSSLTHNDLFIDEIKISPSHKWFLLGARRYDEASGGYQDYGLFLLDRTTGDLKQILSCERFDRLDFLDDDTLIEQRPDGLYVVNLSDSSLRKMRIGIELTDIELEAYRVNPRYIGLFLKDKKTNFFRLAYYDRQEDVFVDVLQVLSTDELFPPKREMKVSRGEAQKIVDITLNVEDFDFIAHSKTFIINFENDGRSPLICDTTGCDSLPFDDFSELSLSPNAKNLAVSEVDQFSIVALNGKELTNLFSEYVRHSGVQWSKDGDRLVSCQPERISYKGWSKDLQTRLTFYEVSNQRVLRYTPAKDYSVHCTQGSFLSDDSIIIPIVPLASNESDSSSEIQLFRFRPFEDKTPQAVSLRVPIKFDRSQGKFPRKWSWLSIETESVNNK